MLDRLGGFVFAVYLLLIGCTGFAIVSAFTFAVGLPGQSLKGLAQVSRPKRNFRRAIAPLTGDRPKPLVWCRERHRRRSVN